MKEAIDEITKPKVIQRTGKCDHVWEAEGKAKGNENKSMTSFVCKKCGYGLLISKEDSIDNH